jgi:hypothetical protein
MGTLICHKEELLYSFFNADQIIDFLLSIGWRNRGGHRGAVGQRAA